MTHSIRIVVAFAITLLGTGAGLARAATPQPIATANRERCVAPCAVLFDATETRAPGIDHPFHMLDFAWDFGDPRNERWAISGRDKNRAWGALAGHLYEHPGRYEATLVVTSPSGASARTKVPVEVLDPEQVFAGGGTVCVSSTGRFDGCPAGARQTTASEFAGAVANRDGRRTLFRRGDTFDWRLPLRLVDASSTGSMIGSFGPDDGRVIVRASGRTTIDPGNDWRVGGLALHGPPDGRGAAFTERQGIRRFTAHDIEVRGFDHCIDFFSQRSPATEVAFIDLLCTEFPDPGRGASLFEDTESSMFLGIEVARGDKRHPEDRTEFGHRAIISHKKLVQHSRYSGRAPNHSKGALQLRHCETAGDWPVRCPDGKFPGRYVIVSDNHFIEGGGPRAHSVIRTCDHASCTRTPLGSQPLSDWIFERNLIQLKIEDPAKEQLRTAMQVQSAHTSIRNNIVDLRGYPHREARARATFVVVPPPSNTARDQINGVWVLHNTVLLSEGFPGTVALCDGPTGGAHHCSNNLLYAPGLKTGITTAVQPTWSAAGNRTVTSGPVPFAQPLAPPLVANLRALDGFRLRPGTPGDSAAGSDLSGGSARWMARDVFLQCRGKGRPDAGAHQRDGADC